MVQSAFFACFASVLLFEKVKCPSEGADGHFNKGIFMKKIFKKGYLYYTRSKGVCQAILPDFFYFTFFVKCVHIWQKSG